MPGVVATPAPDGLTMVPRVLSTPDRVAHEGPHHRVLHDLRSRSVIQRISTPHAERLCARGAYRARALWTSLCNSVITTSGASR